jgi:hypothetical protein
MQRKSHERQRGDTVGTRARPNLRQRAVRILARSLFRELRAQGYSPPQIVSLATELLGEVAAAMTTTSHTR